VQFDCCGASNFTDWSDADLSSDDDDQVASTNASRSGGDYDVTDDVSWSLSVPDSCCAEVLRRDGCGRGVVNRMESRLNAIHIEVRTSLL